MAEGERMKERNRIERNQKEKKEMERVRKESVVGRVRRQECKNQRMMNGKGKKEKKSVFRLRLTFLV